MKKHNSLWLKRSMIMLVALAMVITCVPAPVFASTTQGADVQTSTITHQVFYNCNSDGFETVTLNKQYGGVWTPSSSNTTLQVIGGKAVSYVKFDISDLDSRMNQYFTDLGYDFPTYELKDCSLGFTSTHSATINSAVNVSACTIQKGINISNWNNYTVATDFNMVKRFDLPATTTVNNHIYGDGYGAWMANMPLLWTINDAIAIDAEEDQLVLKFDALEMYKDDVISIDPSSISLGLSFEVKFVDSIEVDTLPYAVIDDNGKVLLSGGTMKVTYNDNSTDIISLEDYYMCVNKEILDNQKVKVTVNYKGDSGPSCSFVVDAIYNMVPAEAGYVLKSGESTPQYVTNDLWVKNNNSNTGGNTRFAYIKYDLDGLKDNLGENLQVAEAKLVYNAKINQANKGDRDIYLKKVKETNWTGSGLTWNNKPVFDGDITTNTVSEDRYETHGVAGYEIIEVDVTDYVVSRINSNSSTATFGFTASNCGGEMIYIRCSGNSKPVLLVTLESAALEEPVVPEVPEEPVVPVVKSIAISTDNIPTMSYNYGDNFDIENGAIAVTYDNGNKVEVPFTSSEVTITGYNKVIEGTQKITVSYRGFTTTYYVYVNMPAGKVADLKCVHYKTPIVGQNFEIISAQVDKYTGVDDNTTTSDITDLNNIQVSGYDKTKGGYQTVTLTYGGYSETLDIYVYTKKTETLKIGVSEANHSKKSGSLADLTTHGYVKNYGNNTMQTYIKMDLSALREIKDGGAEDFKIKSAKLKFEAKGYGTSTSSRRLQLYKVGYMSDSALDNGGKTLSWANNRLKAELGSYWCVNKGETRAANWDVTSYVKEVYEDYASVLFGFGLTQSDNNKEVRILNVHNEAKTYLEVQVEYLQ